MGSTAPARQADGLKVGPLNCMVSLGEGSVAWVFEVGENGSDLACGWERKRGTPFIGLWVGEEERKDENGACVNPDACVYPLRFAHLNFCKKTMHL